MNKNKRSNFQSMIILILISLGTSCLCVSIFIQGFAQNETNIPIPISIQSNGRADYSPDPRDYNANISLDIIADVFRDESAKGEDISERVTDALNQLDTPVPTVTLVISHTPSLTFTPLPTGTATKRPTWTPIPSATPLPTRTSTPAYTAIPTSPQLPSLTNTLAPTQTAQPTNTTAPPPPTLTYTATSTPSSTPIPTHTPTPSDTPIPTETHTPQPTPTEAEIINVEIVYPSNGQIVTDISQTGYEAEAWIGSARINGNDIERVEFRITSVGYFNSEQALRYCAFSGNPVCDTMTQSFWDSLSDGTYILEARACSAVTGDCSGWVSKSFEIQK
ncbi:MAG: hypothetical protein ISR58_12085 [Anaerolineales bacterium]|nr:hypothetical protein [Chloroflexota bacterium]MBL6981916.1 hypothetical protein [Anaerolineales bacterium]